MVSVLLVFEQHRLGLLACAGQVPLSSEDIEPTLPDGVRIRLYGEDDNVLTQNCRIVSREELKFSPNLKTATAAAMAALQWFRDVNGFGRAIAAPQVGYPLRFIVVNLDGTPEVLYNPELTYRSPETFKMWDDCMSFPDQMMLVHRHESVSIKFMDADGVDHVWENLPRDVSELLQHELDHLDGMLMIHRQEGESGNPDIPTHIPRYLYLSNRTFYDSVTDYTIPELALS
jgi:peptide deformylase